jgi:hypothetical protein
MEKQFALDKAAELVNEKLREAGADQSRDYRPPRMFAIGEAAKLIRQSATGQLRDGSGGWYVWGS